MNPLAQGVAFPFDASAPVACAPAAGALHTLARDVDSGRVRHAALGVEGLPQRPVVELDATFVMGFASDGRALAATVALADGQTLALLTLDAGGAVRETTPIAPPAPLAIQPVPLLVEGGGMAIVATTDARLLAINAGAVSATIDCHDATIELAATAIDGDVVVARVHGKRQALQLMRIDPMRGELRGVVEVAEYAVLPGVHRLGDRLAVLWTSGRDGQAWLGSYDADLGVIGEAAAVTATAPEEHVRSARLFVGDGAAALSYVTARPTEEVVTLQANGPPEMRVSEAYAHHVAKLDGGLGAAQPLLEPGVVFHDGGWLGTRLIIVHGSRAPVVSVFGS